jgi:hypothetical protein
LAAAAIAAAIADPLVEWASNAGLFGPGTYTDHSNLDVLPALGIGTAFLAAHLFLRVRRMLHRVPAPGLARISCDALRSGIAPLLPAIFGMQLLTLFAMETIEQVVVCGHVLGGAIWLGAPVAIGLASHALACCAVAWSLSALLHVFATTAVRAIRSIQAMATRPVHGMPPVHLRLFLGCGANLRAFALCSAGGRAPPPHPA